MSSSQDTTNVKWFDKTVKSQISSIKLQINPNFQYSMTKTFNTSVNSLFKWRSPDNCSLSLDTLGFHCLLFSFQSHLLTMSNTSDCSLNSLTP